MKKIFIEEIKDAFILEIEKHEDNRGYFQETFSVYKYITECWRPAQVNVSSSKKNVVRGLHIAPFYKLCTCIRGKLFDVVADCRRNSSTFGSWFGIWLDENCNKQIYVPAGCAHGFYSAEDDTLLLYQQDFPYTPSIEKQIHWKDPLFSIEWPNSDNYILSDKDANAGVYGVS